MKKAFVAISFVLFLVPFSVLSGNSGSVSHKVNVSVPKVALINIVHNGDSKEYTSFHKPRPRNDITDGHWINYSSIVNQENSTRSVMVAILGKLPVGVYLSVQTTSYQGNGNGKTGVPSEKINLSEIPQALITDIGSCYTGTGSNNGHMISYAIETCQQENIKNFNEIGQLVRIVYTLTD